MNVQKSRSSGNLCFVPLFELEGDLSVTDRAVFGSLHSFRMTVATASRPVTPRQSKIAERLGVSRTTVSRAISKLIDSGHLRTANRRGSTGRILACGYATFPLGDAPDRVSDWHTDRVSDCDTVKVREDAEEPSPGNCADATAGPLNCLPDAQPAPPPASAPVPGSVRRA